MPQWDFAAIPHVNEELAEELYAACDDAETRQMQVALWAGAKSDLFKDFDAIERDVGACTSEELRRTLHRVSGYADSSGFMRCAAILRAIETLNEPETGAVPALSAARESAIQTIAAIELRFPHLRGSD